ncbi:hypothetical protein PR048_006910 [Dryococelus australis]|uniref:Uncharacterized protein n=1 Tax=Dryococelus australis TaxID=614101 RepID=A0ABQ9IDL4_9NEOP|nr:hypothetical protein PR048_006910 [Dryococelus australis]
MSPASMTVYLGNLIVNLFITESVGHTTIYSLFHCLLAVVSSESGLCDFGLTILKETTAFTAAFSGENGAAPGIDGRGKREIPENTRRHDSNMRKCGVTRPGIHREKLSNNSLLYTTTVSRRDGNTARLARRSDEALGVRVSVARIAPSLLDLGHAVPSHSLNMCFEMTARLRRTVDTGLSIPSRRQRDITPCFVSSYHSDTSAARGPAQRSGAGDRAKRVRFPAGSLPELWESCQTITPVGGFSQGSSVLPFHSCSAPYSPRFTLIGSQDLDFKSRPNIFPLPLSPTEPDLFGSNYALRLASAVVCARRTMLRFTILVALIASPLYTLHTLLLPPPPLYPELRYKCSLSVRSVRLNVSSTARSLETEQVAQTYRNVEGVVHGLRKYGAVPEQMLANSDFARRFRLQWRPLSSLASFRGISLKDTPSLVNLDAACTPSDHSGVHILNLAVGKYSLPTSATRVFVSRHERVPGPITGYSELPRGRSKALPEINIYLFPHLNTEAGGCIWLVRITTRDTPKAARSSLPDVPTRKLHLTSSAAVVEKAPTLASRRPISIPCFTLANCPPSSCSRRRGGGGCLSRREKLHVLALRVEAMRHSVSPVSLHRFLTSDAKLRPTLKKEPQRERIAQYYKS